MISIGEAQMGLTLSLKIFDAFFKELYAIEAIPHTLTASLPDTDPPKVVELTLYAPDFVLFQAATPRTLLRLRTDAKLDAMEFEDVALQVLLTPVLRARTDDTPVLGLQYDGVPAGEPFVWVGDDTESLTSMIVQSLVTAEQIDAIFADPAIKSVLDGVAIDVVSPMSEALGPIFFEEDAIPAADEWEAALKLMPSEAEAVDHALGIFVAKPGDDADPGALGSVLLNQTEVGLIFSRTFLDTALGAGATETEGTTVGGATIDSLKLFMLDTAIQVDGKASKDDATITFEGPMKLSLARGTSQFVIDASDVDVDVDMPAYYYLLWGLIPFLMLIPGLGGFVLGKLIEAGTAAGQAEDVVQSGLAGALMAELERLADGLRIQAGVGEVTLESTTEASLVDNGHLLLYAQAFVSPVESTIVNAIYNKFARRFTEYHLENGRRFFAPELARLVRIGKFTTPGFHDVGGRYMRANPDSDDFNNLMEMFYPRGA